MELVELSITLEVRSLKAASVWIKIWFSSEREATKDSREERVLSAERSIPSSIRRA
jgi:hypothetical protein